MATGTESVLIEACSAIERNLNEILKEVDDMIAQEVKIPKLEDIKDLKGLYDFYRGEVVFYDKVCRYVSWVGQSTLKLRTVKVNISKAEILASLKSEMNTRVDRMQKKVDNCKEMLIPLKEKTEACLRFYSSAQYMLTSTKFTEISY